MFFFIYIFYPYLIIIPIQTLAKNSFFFIIGFLSGLFVSLSILVFGFFFLVFQLKSIFTTGYQRVIKYDIFGF